jgi:hypothetical protein
LIDYWADILEARKTAASRVCLRPVADYASVTGPTKKKETAANKWNCDLIGALIKKNIREWWACSSEDGPVETIAYVFAAVFFAIWVGFSIFGFKKKWSGVVSIGGGFFISCASLAVVWVVSGGLAGQKFELPVTLSGDPHVTCRALGIEAGRINILVHDGSFDDKYEALDAMQEFDEIEKKFRRKAASYKNMSDSVKCTEGYLDGMGESLG